MANVLTGKMIEKYVTDFDTTIPNLPLKFGKDVPNDLLTTMGYKDTEDSCGQPSFFKPRYFEVKLKNGNVHKLIIPSIKDIQTLGDKLKNKKDILCFHLYGERWGTVLDNFIGNPNFTSEAIKGIPDKKEMEAYRAEYLSDVIGKTIITVQVEKTPENLKKCQIAGLKGAKKVGISCGGQRRGFKPRKFIIKNESDKGSKINRQGIVSEVKELTAGAKGMAGCAICLGYQGESQRNVDQILQIATP